MLPAPAHPAAPAIPPRRPLRGVTLVEVMFALVIQATVMLGIIGSFIQSRRVTEGSVLHAAATAMVYGLIEQVKQLDYSTLLPNYEADPSVPTANGNPTVTPPYIRLRVSQNKVVWLKVVHTAATEANPYPTPLGPTATPSATATAASVGAIDNFIGNIPLSTVTGTASQQINLNLWVWVDEIPSETDEVAEVKKITVVYTYSYLDGNQTRIVRDREVFLRTRFEQ